MHDKHVLIRHTVLRLLGAAALVTNGLAAA